MCMLETESNVIEVLDFEEVPGSWTEALRNPHGSVLIV